MRVSVTFPTTLNPPTTTHNRMLTFVGLGLYDERSITVAGQEAIHNADAVFAEFYTSTLTGTTIETLEDYHDTTITITDREDVEQSPEDILTPAKTESVAFLTAGDPMVSTTHVDLRLRAYDSNIPTRIIHGTSAQTAASSLTGLQNYRFGKATTLPFPDTYSDHDVPQSVIATITDNQDRNLHTLVYLDIRATENDYLDVPTAAAALSSHFPDTLGVGIARAGSQDPVIKADTLESLSGYSFGDPLHLLVIPSSLHELEADALHAFANAPQNQLN